MLIRHIALLCAILPTTFWPVRDVRASEPTSPVTLRIAAASDLKYALDEIDTAFRAENPGARVQISFGSSGNFAAQISRGAPFDVFLSADSSYTKALIREGVVEGDRDIEYARGRLVLWLPRSSPASAKLARLGLKALLDPTLKKIAIANPSHAPYGRAAVQALESENLYSAVKPKLVFGENISQAAQFARTGAAEASLIAVSLALDPNLRPYGSFVEVPMTEYAALKQSLVVLRGSAETPSGVQSAAKAFARFMTGPKARAILQRCGFSLPPP